MPPRLSSVDRARIISLRLSGVKIAEICRELNIRKRTVYWWLRRYDEGDLSLADKPRQRRSRATTEEVDQAILAEHSDNPVQPTRVSAARYSVSMQTIRRRLKEGGLRHQTPKKKEVEPCDTSSAENQSDVACSSETDGAAHVTCEQDSMAGMFRVRPVCGAAGRSFPETRTFTLDQEVLMNMHELSEKIQSFYPTVQGKPFTVTYRGSAGDQYEYVFSSASESRKKGEAHGGLRCDECSAIITGVRYKCATCDDYDMCGACEALGTHQHHIMIRIARPLNHKNPRALLKRWCEAIKNVGIPNFKKVKGGTVSAADTEAAPRPDGIMELSETDDANNTIISHQPITVKFQTQTPPLIRWTPGKKLIKSPLKKASKKKPTKTSERATTEAESEPEPKQVKGSSAAKREGDLNKVKVKVEPHHTDSNIDQPTNNVPNQPNMIKGEANPYLNPGTKCLVVKGNQQWILPGAPVYQSGSPAPVSDTLAAQVGTYMAHGGTYLANLHGRTHMAHGGGTDVAHGRGTDVAHDSGTDIAQSGTNVVHGNGTNVPQIGILRAQSGTYGGGTNLAQSGTYLAHEGANMAQSGINMTHGGRLVGPDRSDLANNEILTYEDLAMT